MKFDSFHIHFMNIKKRTKTMNQMTDKELQK